MSNVLQFNKRASTFAGGEPPDNGDMLQRIEKLENRMDAMQADVQSIKTDIQVMKAEMKHHATKADVLVAQKEIMSVIDDLRKGQTRIIMWTVSAVVLAQVIPPLLTAIRAT